MKNYEDFQKYFEESILNIRNLKHKGNNQLFEIYVNSGRFILKKYARFHMDNWQRGTTEFKALDYLWKKGFREIPKPIAFYEQENIGVYSYEKGRILKPREIKEKDISKAVEFLVKLHNLNNKDKIIFSQASSACLNLKEYINVLDRRVDSLFDYEPKDSLNKKAKSFFNKAVIPKIEELKKDFYQKTKDFNLEKKLPLDEQVLTPADWGFHNILVDKRGIYKFVDFEYFGKDDPVRQILDFVHHAQSFDIKQELKDFFLDSYKEKREVSQDFQKRLELVNPLIAMTWVLIPLNTFSKDKLKNLNINEEGTKKMLKKRLSNAEKKFNFLIKNR